jgi:malonate-semialdehyde dehydrogenase (acetylating) / methylmalonate-semialdehyde dehydrogenase
MLFRLTRLNSAVTRNFATSTPASALNATVRSKAELISAEWKGTSATGGTTKNFIGGKFVESKASEWLDVVDPVRLGWVCKGCCADQGRSVNANITLESTTDHSWGVRPGCSVGFRRLYKLESNERFNSPAVCNRVCPHAQRLLSLIQVRSRLQRLIRENSDALATAIVLEQGKTFAGKFHPRNEISNNPQN